MGRSEPQPAVAERFAPGRPDSDEWITEARAQGRCPPLVRLRSRREVNAWLAGFSG